MTKTQIRVLVVDDDIVDRKACRRALAQHPEYDFVLSEAETGREGLQHTYAEQPDCILLDYRLPDLDGLEFLAELRDDMGEIPIPILMLTGADNALIAVEAMKRGAQDYLVKDVDRRYLELIPTVIERVLRERRMVVEKRQAEEKLSQAEAKYRTLVEQIPAIAYIAALDEAGTALYISPQIKALGYSQEEWLADPQIRLKQIHPDDVTRVVEQFSLSRTSGNPLNCEYRLFTRNGSILWFRDEANIVRDETGQPLFLQGVLVDITESKQVEEELRQHRHRLQELVADRTALLEKRTALLESANANLAKELEERRRAELALFEEKERALVTLESIGDAVITTDASGIISYLNPVAEQFTGWTNTEARGQHLEQVFNVVSEAAREPMESPVMRCLRGGHNTALANHSILIRRDGVEMGIAEQASAIHDKEGKIAGVVMVFRDVTQERKLTQQLSYQATHDPLTGLVNRREFERRMERVLAGSREDGSDHALCYLDLDQFKAVNDDCGHTAGDQLLVQLSAMLQARMRQRDTLARLGGDEFGILLEHCPVDQAWRVAEELLRAVQDFRFVCDGKTHTVGVSIGLVEVRGGEENLATVLNAADTACYQAKRQGRNRVYLYQAEDIGLAHRRSELEWVSRITQSLNEDGFRLYYQSIGVLTPHGRDRPLHEILLRMADENGELILPEVFMPVAERYNLMPALDRWVVRHVLSLLAGMHLKDEEINAPIYSINLSAASLTDNFTLDFIGEQLDEYDVPAHVLGFEITETVALANLTHATHFLNKLKELGCCTTLDNFAGTFSTFASLKNLPVDFLKISGSIVKDIADDRVAQAVVEAINQIAHVMVIQTVAQRAESEAILGTLRRLGVDHAQGYAISIPLPLNETGKGSGKPFDGAAACLTTY
ncbi:MAG TPA: EAL domain-containing protein [Gammaproteobacteria bacterium]|nr:EAL domain-containing protein [Gammaproteobacteria bacterium]